VLWFPFLLLTPHFLGGRERKENVGKECGATLLQDEREKRVFPNPKFQVVKSELGTWDSGIWDGVHLKRKYSRLECDSPSAPLPPFK
jgi:hypothetical protein